MFSRDGRAGPGSQRGLGRPPPLPGCVNYGITKLSITMTTCEGDLKASILVVDIDSDIPNLTCSSLQLRTVSRLADGVGCFVKASLRSHAEPGYARLGSQSGLKMS